MKLKTIDKIIKFSDKQNKLPNKTEMTFAFSYSTL